MTHSVCVNADSALNRLYDQSFTFRFYADYKHGLSVSELALLSSRSERWITERIEAMRLCLEKQVRVEILDAEKPIDRIWKQQVWD
jgi:hypothetical protein